MFEQVGEISGRADLQRFVDADYVVRGEGVSWFRRFLGEDSSAPIRHPAVLSASGGRTMGELVAALAGVLIVSLTVFLSYRFASKLIAYLGETGTAVFLRLSSFILLCIGVSIIWSGLVDLVQPLLTR